MAVESPSEVDPEQQLVQLSDPEHQVTVQLAVPADCPALGPRASGDPDLQLVPAVCFDSEVGGVSPLWHRQPGGSRVSCLCLRCVRARDATRDQCGI